MNFKIGTRLGLGFAAILALTAVMGIAGVIQMARVADAKDTMAAAAHVQHLAQVWLANTEKNIIRTVAVTKSTNAEDRQYFQEDMKISTQQINETQKKLEPLIWQEEGKRLYAAVGGKRKTYLDIRNEIFKLSAAGQPESEVRSQVTDKMIPAATAYLQSVEAVVNYQDRILKESAESIETIYRSGRNLLIVLGIIIIAMGAVLAWLISRSITKPLEQAVSFARTVASGDLSSDIVVTSRDETGQLLQALKHMNESLRRIVGEVLGATDTIATASQQISAGNLDLSSRTEQQAGALEETASSMEELTSTVRQNADNARQANKLTSSASEVAHRGGEVVSKVVDTMGSITESSKRIVDIIGVIDGIAFQTNILALNAAVEAARAGEQGRGFAVVASEVRNLAQRSASAAKEIKGLINDSVQNVDMGRELVAEAGTTMDRIVESVQQVADIMTEITAATQEQSAGIEQVNQAITQMDQTTQQNAALVEEAAAAADSLEGQAGKLVQLVSEFKLEGASARVAAPSLSPRLPSSASDSRPSSAHKPVLKKSSAPSPLRQKAAPVKKLTNEEDWTEF